VDHLTRLAFDVYGQLFSAPVVDIGRECLLKEALSENIPVILPDRRINVEDVLLYLTMIVLISFLKVALHIGRHRKRLG